MNVSALIDSLEADGLPADAILRAVKAATKRRDNTGAERQARYRESKRNAVTVTRDPSPNERDNLTPTRETKTKPNGLSKSLVEAEKREAIASCIRAAYPEPDGVTAEQWSAFRKQRKKALNDRSYTLICNKLAEFAEAGWPPGDMIDRAIERGWETVFKPKDQPNVVSIQRNRPNLTALLRASSGDPESGFGTRPALPASGNG